MNAATRRIQIMGILKKDLALNTTELAKQLDVSVMTIRRDLSLLEKQGILTITHGGAVLNSGTAMEQSYSFKQEHMVEEKQKIGLACLDLINEEDAVYIDCGTTPNEVAVAALNLNKNITVFTNSILAANSLIQAPNIRLHMIPGEFRSKSMGFIGSQTEHYMSNFQFDIAFMGADGIDLVNGVSTPDINDGMTKRAAIQAANKVVVVVDHTKFGKRTLFKITELKELYAVVTGEGIPEKYKEVLQNLDLHFVQVQ